MDRSSWWRDGVLYQIYPRSFGDSNGDGIGDLRGITARLDHLEWLGIDGIWLNPTFPSPNDDWGYDVSDYTAVHPDLGTLEDLDELIAEAGERGIRVLLDLVPNHTSDRHPWFAESRSSRDNPKADWYVWADPRPDGSPPNNWVSMFGGPAWEWEPRRAQFYLRNFTREQPDLNWWCAACARSSTASCASGSTAASTASASTSARRSSRTARCATTLRRRPAIARTCACAASGPSCR